MKPVVRTLHSCIHAFSNCSRNHTYVLYGTCSNDAQFSFHFQDLKKYHFYYWFGFPALCPQSNIALKGPPKPITDVLTPNQVMLVMFLF